MTTATLYDGAGYVRLVETWGSDEQVIASARMSTDGAFRGWGTPDAPGDEKLLRYLWTHQHFTPFEMAGAIVEMQVPVFVMRQIQRHRTACLAGDTNLMFDLPAGTKHSEHRVHRVALSKAYETFVETGNGLLDSRKKKLCLMRLRSVNEQTGEVYHTRIRNIWQSGVKQLYRLRLEGGQELRMSEDHLCLTDRGWLRLKEAVDLSSGTSDIKFATIQHGFSRVTKPRAASVINTDKEEWRTIPGWNEYEVSDAGRVRRVASGKGARRGIKKQSVGKHGYPVVSFSRGGITRAFTVHSLVLLTFAGPRPIGHECRHLNGDRQDCRLENLAWGTPTENSQDRIDHGTSGGLMVVFGSVVECIPDGEEMTYDVEVDGPWHNFSANGMVVHNSFNELSARYTELPETFWLPRAKDIRRQLPGKGQGGVAGDGADWPQRAQLAAEMIENASLVAFGWYRELIRLGVAREQARAVLPMGTMTRCRMQANLRLWTHFLGLRLDPHAQAETRVVAQAIAGFLRTAFPRTMALFDEGRAS